MNSHATKWEKQLPEEVQGDLSKSRQKKGGLETKTNETKEEEVDTKGGACSFERHAPGLRG
jgi:hypothetical protein